MSHSVLVTGGSGFIGTWVLRELLESGARAVALDVRPATERWNRVLGDRAKDVIFSDVSLTDRDGLAALMKQHDVSHVIHLAALLTPDCQQDPFCGCQVNVLGSTAVFDAARRVGSVQAIALASSYAVYGDGGADASQPPMFYGAFKQSVDLIAAQYWRHFGLRSLAIRPHVVYGPEREAGLTAGPSLACRAAVRGAQYEIGYSGTAGYDYVEDVARAFVRGALECPPGATIADLPSEPATTQEVVQWIERSAPESRGRITVFGPPIPSNVPSEPRDIRQVLPGWQPTRLAEGIAKTIAFYRNAGGTA
ncbi:dTDP-4-dehydro-6-deoxyglucose reductase [Anatilimnocola aggregata]|uniref:dTDP-4-dehydro-6-deoxyglucose reductase n=1 Tax=Anatilimnocola aggregata TaxID=2528021 RepID=A0A517Y422_9BACT|nr:NAD(P)-dependent oxidoreductase [Anatilimnocola aggregata]QDU24993.1 dTDP-4-dehydro-6-deoxyglucose reductase [Anatilimnocola aggregata]